MEISHGNYFTEKITLTGNSPNGEIHICAYCGKALTAKAVPDERTIYYNWFCNCSSAKKEIQLFEEIEEIKKRIQADRDLIENLLSSFKKENPSFVDKLLSEKESLKGCRIIDLSLLLK